MSAAPPTGMPRQHGFGIYWIQNGTRLTHPVRPPSAGSSCPTLGERPRVIPHNGSLPFVVVHGLGRALVPAIELALHLDRVAPNVYSFAVHTSTVQLHDDVDPLNEVRRAMPSPRLGRVRA